MKINKINKTNIFIILSAFSLLQGCSLNEGELWGLGSFVFLVFLVVLVLNKTVPLIQEQKQIKILIEKSKPIIIWLFYIFMLISIVLIAFGINSIFSNEDRSREDLILFIGIMFLYFSINMMHWVKEKNDQKKRNYVKYMGLSISFIFIMFYVLTGASGLSL